METIFDGIKKRPKLFEEEHSHKHWTVVQILKTDCLGYEQRKMSDFIIEKANKLLAFGKIEDSAEFRAIIKDLRNSEIFMRIIGTTTSGYWLALSDDEKDPNQMLKNRATSAIETCIRNGVDINYFFKNLNELKDLKYPVDNQTRHPFNSEKTTIKRYSDDLIKKGENK